LGYAVELESIDHHFYVPVRIRFGVVVLERMEVIGAKLFVENVEAWLADDFTRVFVYFGALQRILIY